MVTAARQLLRRHAADVVLVLLVAASTLFVIIQTTHLATVVRASCASAADVAHAPVAADAVTHRASMLGVQLVSDFRAQWRGLGCQGTEPPPDPSFVRWARYYHLPVN